MKLKQAPCFHCKLHKTNSLIFTKNMTEVVKIVHYEDISTIADICAF